MLKELMMTVMLSGFLHSAYDEPIHLAFAGDTMMDWSVKETIRNKGADYPFKDVKSLIEKADYAVLNLETAVTEKNETYEKQFNFKSHPESLKGVEQAGFDLLSLANNHVMDYQEEGLLDTLKFIKKENLHFMGAGENSEEAYAAHRILVKGKTISFLAFSHVLPSYSWYAQTNKPGVASGYDINQMKRIIKEEKAQNDFVFVNIHWGEEAVTEPLSYQRDYAKQMIDAGADGIIGHHPHVLQGFEYYKGKPIAYSLGNFLFPNYVTGKSAQTGVLMLTVKGDEIGFSFNPYYIEKDRIAKKDKTYESDVLQYLEGISPQKGIHIQTFEK